MLDNTKSSLIVYVVVLLAIHEVTAPLPLPILSDSDSISNAAGASSAAATENAATSGSKGAGTSTSAAATAGAVSTSKGVGSSSAAAAAAASSASKGAGSSSASAAAAASASKGVGSSSSAAAAASATSALKETGFNIVKLSPIPQPPPVPRPDPITYPLPKPTCNSNPRYVVIHQNIPTSGSIFANDPTVIVFTNAFLDTVYKMDILKEVFDINKAPVKLFAEFFKQYTAEYATRQGFPNAEPFVETIRISIMKNFGCSECPRFSLGILSRIFANFMAHSLFVNDHLSLDNADSLGAAFARSVAYSASINMNSDPTSKFLPLAEGIANFVHFAEPNMINLFPIYAFYFSNEYYAAAVNYRWL